MDIVRHPKQGALVEIGLDKYGFEAPEMVKLRLGVVLSKPDRSFKNPRNQVCVVVPCSTTDPDPVRDYHYRLELPDWYNTGLRWTSEMWVIGNQIFTLRLESIDYIRLKKSRVTGKREYQIQSIPRKMFEEIQRKVLIGIGYE